MLFLPTSRYYLIETSTFETDDGKVIRYLQRRFIPGPERFTAIRDHLITQEDRLDIVTAQYLGDPEQFWRICDANAAMRPDELTETVGRRIRITLPEGIPGMSHA